MEQFPRGFQHLWGKDCIFVIAQDEGAEFFFYKCTIWFFCLHFNPYVICGTQENNRNANLHIFTEVQYMKK